MTDSSEPSLSGNPLPVQDSVQRAGEGADFLSECSRAAADEQRPSDARRTAGLERKRQVGIDINRPVLAFSLKDQGSSSSGSIRQEGSRGGIGLTVDALLWPLRGFSL